MTETKPTLPGETISTEITRFNALRHGLLSRHTVLPWEERYLFNNVLVNTCRA
jgi:hypothetical protein